MRIQGVYVVCNPDDESEIEDILFYSNWNDLHLYFKGILTFDEVEGFYTEKEEARAVAISLMRARKCPSISSIDSLEVIDELKFMLENCLEKFEDCNGKEIEQIVIGKSGIERIRSMISKIKGEST